MSVTTLALRTSAPSVTRDLAAAVAPLLVPGDVLSLAGPLGAGKTCFVQGVARGLGIEERVTSPTYVLVRQYEGRLPLVHCDVYRLETLGDVHDLGDDVLATDVVTVVEWGDAIAVLLPPDRLEVTIEHADDAGAPVDAAAGAPAVADAGPSADADDAGAPVDAAADRDGGAEVTGDVRWLTVRALGSTWDLREGALRDALAPWS